MADMNTCPHCDRNFAHCDCEGGRLCKYTGMPGHTRCGVCFTCGRPRTRCGCGWQCNVPPEQRDLTQKCLAKGIPVEAMEALLECCAELHQACRAINRAKSQKFQNLAWIGKLEMLEGILRAQNTFLAKLLEE